MNIVSVLDRAARRHGDRPFLTDRTRTASFRSASEQSERVGAALHAQGVRPGDTVGICGVDSVDAWIAIFGVWRVGALPSLIDARTPADRLAYFVGDVGAPLTLADAACIDALTSAGSASVLPLGSFVSDAPAAPCPSVHGDDAPLFLSYTSGTTGDPKGAVLLSGPCTLATSCIAERLGFVGSDVLLATTPIASSFQLVAAIMPAMHVGAHVVLAAGRPVPEICAQMSASKATVLVAYPLTLADVVATVDPGSASTLRLALSGGSPLAPRIKRDYIEKLGVPLIESYGQSELGGFMALGSPGELAAAPPGFAGRSLPDRLTYVMAPDGSELPPGVPGEVVVAEGYFDSYRNKTEQYAEATAGGVLHTGDVGVADANGFVKVLGRTREGAAAAARGGFLRDVEDALYEHPGVRHAAAVERDNRIVCFVECHPGVEVGETELLDFVVRAVPAGLVPSAVHRLEAMPRTFSGKADRLRLSTLEHV